jgi:hypothetical protein
VDISNLETSSVRGLILGHPGSSVELLLSISGRVCLKRTQFVRADPASPPAAVQPALLSSPCFPSNTIVTPDRFRAEAQEDC